MRYRLIAFDLDGTLLNRNKQILPESLTAIRQMQDMGCRIMLVTGRSHREAYAYYQTLALTEPMICCNGSYIYQVLHPLPLTHLQAEKILARVYPLKPTIRADDKIIFQADELSSRENIWQISVVHRHIKQLQNIAEFIQHELQLSCTWSWHHQLDILQKGCSKGQSLARYAQQQHIAMREVMAFGDNDNDAEMLRLAGLGVAMGNASARAKVYADSVIGRHNTPAIADFLATLSLSQRE
ncbi:TPA: Cof-type HAD-IIB family hydrolase [Salmonella enterica subsp. enterica serovar Mississippi]|uniref:HAD family phosphatase n=1 Tax=Salmonella enterica I TaxID=59201 RepID=A0A612EVM9_SALET|nr:Cof-type HAD-IIB family hydrolase [Salmonella enterica]ECV9893826.1 HAD family phosphatase [Salmonella enterica subsp. enterica]HEC7039432.1 HAD family phosphatase [Salmonella enterica subsp. enterica serovar Mississippi]ECV9897940.1 HAD family phosphatase [Salmonella enterica subsp. enterica]ECV9901753.1 HAD family phosphatase [Salmonella enterica subsp. enterica]ECV9907306.1 HAD family phosphatase [Salmonella enterica subsp. enterica]